MITIRIFGTRQEAESASEILKQGGISSEVTEDNFEGIPIQNFNVPARYRLRVNDSDYYKTAKYLARKLKDIK